MPFSHRRIHRGTRYVYSELANKILRSAKKRAGLPDDSRTQYSFRHTWNTDNYGTMPQEARLLIMGHVKNRPEYTHLSPLQALERVLIIPGVKEAMGITEREEF